MDTKGVIVILSEGKTEHYFYEKVINHIRIKNNNELSPHITIVRHKLDGENKFVNMGIRWVKANIVNNEKYKNKNIYIFLCYDSDILKTSYFNISRLELENKYKSISSKIMVFSISPEKSIEDYYLLSIPELLKYLNINTKEPPSFLKSNITAEEKMKKLYDTSKRISFKSDAKNIIDNLDMNKIFPHICDNIKPLCNQLGLKCKGTKCKESLCINKK